MPAPTRPAARARRHPAEVDRKVRQGSADQPRPASGATSVVLHPEIGIEAVDASLPPKPRFFVSAKGGGGVEPVEGVGPDHSGAKPAGHLQDPAPLLRPDP